VEPQEYDEMLRTLVRIAAHQETINQDQWTITQELREFNARQLEINQRLEVTQARIEALLARMIPQGENGAEA